LKLVLTPRLLPLIAALILVSCKFMLESDYNASQNNGSGQTGTSGTVLIKASDFIISNEISGWTADPSGTASYSDPMSLQQLIDGGYNDYTDNGMIEGIQEVMNSSDGHGNRIWVMDFGTADKATTMYQFEQTRLTGRTAALQEYADSIAIAKVNLSSITVYAHFNRFYFQLAMSNYSPATLATGDADLFLEFYQAKAARAGN
jgi:hypothetical protein